MIAISLCLTLRLCRNILSVCFFINIIDIITEKKNPWSSLYMFTPPMDFDIFDENQMLSYKGFSLYINLIQFYKSVPISLNNYSLTFLQQLSLPFLHFCMFWPVIGVAIFVTQTCNIILAQTLFLCITVCK